MRNCLVLACLSALAASVASAEVYRWVDEDGVVHYSDSPHPGAEEIELPEPAAATAAPRASRTLQRPARGSDDADRPPAFDYETLAVIAPAPEETLWNIEGELTVRLSVQPALRPGDLVRVYLDGEPREVPDLQFDLQEVYRGTHNLQAEILDEAGQLMIRSEPIRFYVQQTSIVNPN